MPARRRNGKRDAIVVRGARENNLKGIDVAFPLGKFVAVTGVSGSGKSSLVTQILHPALAQRIWGSREPAGTHDRIEGIDLIDKVIEIDQSPIGRTPRSNPATYTGLWGPLRELLAAVPESRLRGYKPGRFSFNVKGGRCEACEGAGIVQIEMHFLPDVYVQCEVCKGKRYNRETLEIHYKGKNVAEILEMTVEEALKFFDAVPSIKNKLQTLFDVGMGYIHLGQPATTLSGGEAQRVKLATELSKRATGQDLLHPRRADHRPPLRRRGAPPQRAVTAGREREHRRRHRAQPRRHQDGGLGDRPRPGRRRQGRGARRGRDAGAGRRVTAVVHRALPPPRPRDHGRAGGDRTTVAPTPSRGGRGRLTHVAGARPISARNGEGRAGSKPRMSARVARVSAT